MILGIFIEFLESKYPLDCQKTIANLILTVGFDFGSNLTVGSSYIR